MTNTEKNVEIGLFLGGKLSESKERIFLWEDEVMYFAIQRDILESRYRLKFDTDWNWFMKAWEKFRDLEIDSTPHNVNYHYVTRINLGSKILHGTISEAFEALYEGVNWYQNFNK